MRGRRKQRNNQEGGGAAGRHGLTRDLALLGSREFDLVVIGGGIAGAGVAWDAALRGLSVALLDRGDFGAATSSGCFRIVHGGLRYLQHLDLSRLQKSVREQRRLRRIAPHLLAPLPVLVPCYGRGKKGKTFLKLGVRTYELLTRDRNRNVAQSLCLDRASELTKDEVLEAAPRLSPDDLRGGIVFHDVQMRHAERLTVAVALAAREAGAVICNYTEVTGGRAARSGRRAPRIEAVRFRDVQTGQEGEVRCRMIVNATGVFATRVAALLVGPDGGDVGAVRSLLPNGGLLSKGFQVALPGMMDRYAVAIESRERDHASIVSRGGRSFFLVPWRGLTLIGTTDAAYRGDPEDFAVEDAEIDEFLAAVRAAYPDPRIRTEEVRYAFGGLLPTQPLPRSVNADTGDAVRVLREDLVIEHRDRTRGELRADNMITAIAVKYTTFRALAEDVVDKVCQRLPGRFGHCRTSFTPVAGGSTGDPVELLQAAIDDFGGRLPRDRIEHLVYHYGSDMLEVLGCGLEHSSLLEPIAPGAPVLGAEILHAVRREQALTFDDVVFRRTLLGVLGFPGAAAIDRAVQLMGSELGWDKVRQEEEAERVLVRFRMRRDERERPLKIRAAGAR